MAELGISDPPARGFISYRRVDNDEFGGVVDEFARTLSGVFEASTGQALELFIDRDSIGWGEDWRGKIESSVRRATFFIPIITMRYFASQICMDEFTAFESTARNLGVTELILPIVLFGSDQISLEDARPEVQAIANLNYRSIEAAWEAGYASPEWRKFVNDRAKELSKYISQAEALLVRREELKGPVSPTATTQDETDPHVDGDFDMFELSDRLQRATIAITAAGEILEQLADVASDMEAVDLEGISGAQANARLISFAHSLSEPSKQLEVAGSAAEREVRDLDPLLREWIAEIGGIRAEQAVEQIRPLLDALAGIDDLSEAQSQISETMELIQFMSLMSVAFRRSLRPAVNGLRSLTTAMRTYEAWRGLGS